MWCSAKKHSSQAKRRPVVPDPSAEGPGRAPAGKPDETPVGGLRNSPAPASHARAGHRESVGFGDGAVRAGTANRGGTRRNFSADEVKPEGCAG